MDDLGQLEYYSEFGEDCYSPHHLGSKINYQVQYDLSIMVPCYNNIKYVPKCIGSILGQVTNYSYQVICVDDGSTDGTGQYLDTLSYDPRIVVLHQTNRGHSGARNTALSYAAGQYLMFVDSDDILLPNAIENLLQVAKEGYDIVQGKYFSFRDDEVLYKLIQNQEFPDLEGKEESPLASWPGYPWMKVFHRQLFSNIVFPVGLWFEDTIIVFLIYSQAKKSAQINQFVYGYRNNPDSVTHVATKSRKSIDTFLVTKMMLHMIKKYHIPMTNQLYNSFLNQILINSARLWRFPYSMQKKVCFQTIDCLYRTFQEDCIGFNPMGIKKKILVSVVKHNIFFPIYMCVIFVKMVSRVKRILMNT